MSTTQIAPEFEFLIPKNDTSFPQINRVALNIPGFSVTNTNTSSGTYVTNTNKGIGLYIDGEFSLLNKNNITIYYKDFVFVNGIIRSNVGGINKILNIIKTTTDTTSDINYVIETYTVSYNDNLIGTLKIKSPIKFFGTNNPIYPFEKVDFLAAYNVENANDLTIQYFGASKQAPDKRVGTIDMTFNFECYNVNPNDNNVDSSNILIQETVLSCNLVKGS